MKPSAGTYLTLMGIYANQKNENKMLEYFEEFKKSQFKLGIAPLLILLNFYAKNGNFDKVFFSFL